MSKEFEDDEFDWGEETGGTEASPHAPDKRRKNVNPQAQRMKGVPNPNVRTERREATNHNYEGNPPQQRSNLQNEAERRKEQQQTVVGNAQVQNDDTEIIIQQPSNKKSPMKMVVVVGAVIVVIGAMFAMKQKQNNSMEQENGANMATETYETSGKFALDAYKNAVINYDAPTIDSLVGESDGDSYVAQEWGYVNGVSLREEFIKKVCGLVEFTYPENSYMNNGESLKVRVPDYKSIADTMNEDKDYIRLLFMSSGYDDEDYTWNDEMVNLLLQYICDKESIPTKEVEINIPLGVNANGQPAVMDDAVLDDVLFGNDDLHYCCARFSQICLEWTGKKYEFYFEKEERDNKEYKEWKKLFDKYFKEDGGSDKFFNKYKSKWEPWYLRDENNNYILDENGEKIVNYYSVKDENNKDWIEPDKKILVDVQKSKELDDPWVEETAIPYNWIGTNFIKNHYEGKYDTTVRVGDGSKEHPAGIGTSIITKVICTDGKYHDVKVSLMGYWTNQSAIDYAEAFDTRNRGFTITSVVRLICYEVKVENLESEPIEIISEMTLADGNSNISSRTGTMFGFTETQVIEPKQSVLINDWASSTELEQKYVCWGKSFKREIPMVYFNILAGSGYIPPYSAYKYFTGKSNIDESVNIDVSGNEAVPAPEPVNNNVKDDTENAGGEEQQEPAPLE